PPQQQLERRHGPRPRRISQPGCRSQARYRDPRYLAVVIFGPAIGWTNIDCARPRACVMMRACGTRLAAPPAPPIADGEADISHLTGTHTRTTLAAAALAVVALADPGTTSAQGAPAGATTPDRIKAATQAIDGAAIQTNASTSKNWPTIGADYAETRYSKLAE